MYSSYLGGVVTDPALMTVPADDHVVHRGDGVFESLRCIDGAVYNMADHMNRLRDSAEALDYRLPCSMEEIAERIKETIRIGGKRDCSVRVIISRGPGGLGANPYECTGSQLYIIVSRTPAAFMSEHPDGARIKTSAIPVKTGRLANIKSCNYLPNAMMKKEAADSNVDFVVSFDNRGFLGEGPTESAGIVTADKELLLPNLESVLRGTTAGRVMKLAATLVEEGVLSCVERADISRQEIAAAGEMLIIGTSCNVVSVVEFDGVTIGNGVPGPVAARLGQLLDEDMRSNESIRAPVLCQQ
jgi:branched-chain amino acid aminotransferase